MTDRGSLRGLAGALLLVLLSGCGHSSNFYYAPKFKAVSTESAPQSGTEAVAGIGDEIYRETAYPIAEMAIIESPLDAGLPTHVSRWSEGSIFVHTSLVSETAYCKTVMKGETSESAEGFHCFLDPDRDGMLDVAKYRPLGRNHLWIENRNFQPVRYNIEDRTAKEDRRFFGETRVIELTGISGNAVQLVLRARQLPGDPGSFAYNNSYDITLSDGRGVFELRGLVIEITRRGDDQITYHIKQPFEEWASAGSGGRFSYKLPLP